MGASTALLMARRGADVTLFEAAPAPMTGASRWNEGKIHLGHLYAADPSLATARRVLAGGLAFPRLLRMLIDTPLDDAVTPADDVYAVHRDSIVAADAAAAYFDAVTALARQHPEARAYFTDLRHAAVRRLSPAELARDHDPSRVVAAFAVPERSIDTRRVADRIVGALHAQSGLALRLGTRVDAVGRDTDAGRLHVSTSAGREGPFDLVVNALWQGRLAIDATLGLAVPSERSHRYRLSVFARADGPVELPSTVVATGPFGDVKHYGGGRLYLSWYPAGLRAQGDGIAPPPLPALDADARERIADATLRACRRPSRPSRDCAVAWSSAASKAAGCMRPAPDRSATTRRACTVATGWVSSGAAATCRSTPANIRSRRGWRGNWSARCSATDHAGCRFA